jgi:hypothetical protein
MQGTIVDVTCKDIRRGISGDCFRCAVAIATGRATGDKEARLVEVDWLLHLVVWGRWIVADPEVRDFVRAFDSLERGKSRRPILPKRLAGDIAPFRFVLPPHDSPEWQEECCSCESLVAPDDLDDEGECRECREVKGTTPC